MDTDSHPSADEFEDDAEDHGDYGDNEPRARPTSASVFVGVAHSRGRVPFHVPLITKIIVLLGILIGAFVAAVNNLYP